MRACGRAGGNRGKERGGQVPPRAAQLPHPYVSARGVLGPTGVTTHPQWHNRNMESDGQLPLYDLVAVRLKEAHAMVRALQVPDDVRAALSRRLLAVTAAAKHDLAGAARRLERLVEDIEAGNGLFPGEREDRRADRSA